MGKVIAILCLCFVFVYGTYTARELRTFYNRHASIRLLLSDRKTLTAGYKNGVTELDRISQNIIDSVNTWLNEQVRLLKNTTLTHAPSLVTNTAAIERNAYCTTLRNSIMLFGGKIIAAFQECGNTYKKFAVSLQQLFKEYIKSVYNEAIKSYADSLDCAAKKDNDQIERCLNEIMSRHTPAWKGQAIIERFIETAKWHNETMYLTLQNCPYHADMVAFDVYSVKIGSLFTGLHC